jgi:hypothetical protein
MVFPSTVTLPTRTLDDTKMLSSSVYAAAQVVKVEVAMAEHYSATSTPLLIYTVFCGFLSLIKGMTTL